MRMPLVVAIDVNGQGKMSDALTSQQPLRLLVLLVLHRGRRCMSVLHITIHQLKDLKKHHYGRTAALTEVVSSCGWLWLWLDLVEEVRLCQVRTGGARSHTNFAVLRRQ